MRRRYRYLCGYCVCTEHRGFYIAKTFLTPGMKGTPEHDAWEGDQQELFKRASKLTYRGLIDHQDYGPSSFGRVSPDAARARMAYAVPAWVI